MFVSQTAVLCQRYDRMMREKMFAIIHLRMMITGGMERLIERSVEIID